MKKHFQCNSKSFLVRSFWAACADLVNIKILLNSERAANEITKKIITKEHTFVYDLIPKYTVM